MGVKGFLRHVDTYEFGLVLIQPSFCKVLPRFEFAHFGSHQSVYLEVAMGEIVHQKEPESI